MNSVPLNGDMMTYYYSKTNLIMVFSNSKISYHLPRTWKIEVLSRNVVPYRIIAPKYGDRSITVATSTICNEVNLLKFIKELVNKYNDPNLTKIKAIMDKRIVHIDINSLEDSALEESIKTPIHKTELLQT